MHDMSWHHDTACILLSMALRRCPPIDQQAHLQTIINFYDHWLYIKLCLWRFSFVTQHAYKLSSPDPHDT